jgi:dTDP-L-rhamnose 4-epimerase
MSDRVLVTGGAGFIGSFVVDHFLHAGYSVRVLDNLDPQVHPQGRPGYLSADAELRVGDVRDTDAVEAALDGIQLVVHCASAVGVGQSMYRVQHYLDVNVNGTATLLQALIAQRREVAKIVIPTSMTAYGEGLYRRPSDGIVRRVGVRLEAPSGRDGWEPLDPETGEALVAVPTPETAELLARNVYALSKRYQEELALSLGAFYQLPVTCLRLFNVFGPRQSLSNPYTGVLAIFLSRLLQGEAPIVYEDGRQTRDFVSVHDVVRAIALASREGTADEQVLNVGTGVPRGIADVARSAATLLGRDLEPEITGQFRRGDIRHCFADAARAHELLGFAPAADWAASLLETAEWSLRAPRRDNFRGAAAELAAFGLIRPTGAA